MTKFLWGLDRDFPRGQNRKILAPKAPERTKNMRQARMDKATLAAYWTENKRLTAVTLIIWAIVSFGAVFFVEALNAIVIFGFPFGYYMGAQGSLIVFVLLIFNYSRTMNLVDRKYNQNEEE